MKTDTNKKKLALQKSRDLNIIILLYLSECGEEGLVDGQSDGWWQLFRSVIADPSFVGLETEKKYRRL